MYGQVKEHMTAAFPRTTKILVIFGLLSVLSTCDNNSRNSVFQGYIEGDYLYVSSPIGGKVIHLFVEKGDRVDAEKLARYARLDPEVLRPITHRSVAMQEILTLIRARAVMVRARIALVNAARGLAKPCGYRLPSVSTSSFAKRCLAELPAGLLTALEPLVELYG